MDNIGAAATFLSDWSDALANAQKKVQTKQKLDHDRAMETFAEAMRDCDKAVESIVEKHQENVAKSAEKLKEYHKKLAREEQRQRAADEQRLFFEEALISSINARNMRKEDMLADAERREDLAAR